MNVETAFMKKAIFSYLFVFFWLISFCTCSKDQSKKEPYIGQENTFGQKNTVDPAIYDYLKFREISTESIVDIVEIFKLDKIDIILSEGGTFLPRYLPDDTTIIKITNESLFEYSSSSLENNSRYEEKVKIFKNDQVPFYKSESGMGFGGTETSFFYEDGQVIMHIDHVQHFPPRNSNELSEEEIVERLKDDYEKLIFDAIFKKVITKKEKRSQATGVINNNEVRLRAKPELSGDILFNLDDREKIEIIGISENKHKNGEKEEYWYEVRIKYKKIFGDERDYDIEGWIFGAYIDY
jgi:hypothetical protein